MKRALIVLILCTLSLSPAHACLMTDEQIAKQKAEADELFPEFDKDSNAIISKAEFIAGVLNYIYTTKDTVHPHMINGAMSQFEAQKDVQQQGITKDQFQPFPQTKRCGG